MQVAYYERSCPSTEKALTDSVASKPPLYGPPIVDIFKTSELSLNYSFVLFLFGYSSRNGSCWLKDLEAGGHKAQNPVVQMSVP